MSQGYRVYDPSGLSVTLAGKAGGLGAKTGLYMEKQEPQQFSAGGGVAHCIDKNYHKGIAPSQVGKGRRTQVIANSVPSGHSAGNIYHPLGLAPTIRENHGKVAKTVVEKDVRIRRLTPKECWRLQGFPDKLFNKVEEAGVSDTQLYRQAGNSVTVNVIEAIGKRLKEIEQETKKG